MSFINEFIWIKFCIWSWVNLIVVLNMSSTVIVYKSVLLIYQLEKQSLRLESVEITAQFEISVINQIFFF